MKRHLALLALAILLLSSSCFSGGDHNNGDPEAVRQSKLSAQNLALDITAKNLTAAASFIDENFVLDSAVADKFDVGDWQGKGPDAFREFFQRVVDKYGDIQLLLTFTWWEVQGNKVLLHSRVEFAGNNGNAQPHAELSFEEDDLLTFQWNGTLYALIGWEEDPNPNPPSHNEGNGGNF
jgi:hypothetical protein